MQSCEQQELQPPTDIDDEPAGLLRWATAGLHRQLDQRPPLRALLRPGVGPAQLAVVTDAFSRCFAWLDPALASAERKGALPAGCRPYQPRSAWLQPTATIEPQPAEALFGAAYWGARYVAEGSTLGSRVILHRLQSVECLVPGALDYWRYQVDESAYWQAFRRALNDRLVSPAECRVAVAAARSVFGRFIDEFDIRGQPAAVRQGGACQTI